MQGEYQHDSGTGKNHTVEIKGDKTDPMKKVLIAVLVLFSPVLWAEDLILLDNSQIHQYKGETGKWEYISSSGALNRVVQRYGSSLEDVRSVNGSISYNSYLFIPFSEEYITEFKESGITRSRIFSEPDSFIWPLVDVNRISSAFGMRNGRLHTGVDLPAPRGTPILAVKDGMVSYSGYAAGHGNTVVIQHRDSYYTRYSHNSVLLVKNGDYVKKGQIIAMVGSTGNSTGNHLHFEIRYNDIPLDPLDFLPEDEKYDRVYLLNNR